MGYSYAYDPLGRRTMKTVSGTTTNFLHDGDSEIAEYDGTGALIRRFVPGPTIDEYIAMVTAGGATTFFHTDKMGSVVAMSDTGGVLTAGPYLYDEYGICYIGGVSCNAAGIAAGSPFRFTGQRFDPENVAYYFRARIYSPLFGRFFQTDPVGYRDDLNLYLYVGNDPSDRSDPTGLFGMDDPRWDDLGKVQMQWVRDHPKTAAVAAVASITILALPAIVAACAGGGCEAGVGAFAARLAASAAVTSNGGAILSAAHGDSPQKVLSEGGRGAIVGPVTTASAFLLGPYGAFLGAYLSMRATGGGQDESGLAGFAAGLTELITKSPAAASAVGGLTASVIAELTGDLTQVGIVEGVHQAKLPHRACPPRHCPK